MKPFETIEAALTYAELWGCGPFVCVIRCFRMLVDISDAGRWKLDTLGRIPE